MHLIKHGVRNVMTKWKWGTTMDSRITELHELIHDLEDLGSSYMESMFDDIVDQIQITINKIKDEQRKGKVIIWAKILIDEHSGTE